jgi:hypothetical protein
MTASVMAEHHPPDLTQNGFILLVDDRQVKTLDEEIRVRPGTQVKLLKLIPLAGG